MNHKKIIVVGDAQVGKSFWCRSLTKEVNNIEYKPTLGVEIYVYQNYNIWDCAGQKKYGGLRDGYYTCADFAMVFFDVGKMGTFSSIEQWIKGVVKKCGDIPVVIVGNRQHDSCLDSYIEPYYLEHRDEIISQMRDNTKANIVNMVFIDVKNRDNIDAPFQTIDPTSV